jgi:uncharacterized protein YxjI/Zn-finger nucleic acid-binding protein
MGPLDAEAGVVVDTCTACRAAWFDRGELARVTGCADDLPSLDAAAEHATATVLPCPRCRGASLVEMPYAPGRPLTVATCAACQGVLASLGDLRAMRELSAASRVPTRPTAALASAADTGAIERVAERFRDLSRLTVKQQKRMLEILTGLEQRNLYTVLGPNGGAVFVVAEHDHGLFALLRRMFLGPLRPFEAHVEDTRRGSIAMRLRRPFRWILQELEVCDAEGALLARIARRWTFFSTRYELYDAAGACFGEVHGPFFRPWTFEVRAGDAMVACVRKKWSGLLTEALTDADNFELTFEPGAPARWKPLALACAILIDIVHFENSKR